MPQPVSSSMSMLVHRRPLLLCSRYSTGASAVIVIAGPNITWPTSTLTSGWAFTYSITCGRGRAPALARLAAVAVELEMGEVRAPAGQRLHGRERGRRVARHAEVVAVDVHRMRKAERVRRVGERLEDRRAASPRGPPTGIVEPGHVALPRLPRLDAARVHDLHRVAAGGAEQPGGVVARAVALARARSGAAGTRRCPSARRTRRPRTACRPARRGCAGPCSGATAASNTVV